MAHESKIYEQILGYDEYESIGDGLNKLWCSDTMECIQPPKE